MPVVIGLVVALAALAIYERSKTNPPVGGLKPATSTPPTGLSQSTAGEVKDIFGAIGSGIDSLGKLKDLLGLGSNAPSTATSTGANTFTDDVGPTSGDDNWTGTFQLQSEYFDF